MEIATASRRNLQELFDTLRRHLRLLRQFYWQAFSGGDPDYRGELAVKLRLLVCEDSNGYALLTGMMREMDKDVTFNREPAAPPVSLRQYLDLNAATLPIPPRGRIQLGRKDIIALWAHDHGSRQEDWALHGEYAVLRELGVSLDAHPALVQGLKETAWTVLQVGEKFIGMLEPEQLARKAAEKTLRTQRDGGGASLQRGAAYAQLGQYEAALEEFQGILDKDPWNPKAQNNRALALHHLGRHREAEMAYRECSRLDPGYADPRYNLACLYALQGQFRDSLAELEKVLPLGGFSGRLSPMTDPDFNLMRQDAEFGPLFRDLMARD